MSNLSEKQSKRILETSIFDVCPDNVFVMSPETKVLINNVANTFNIDRHKLSDRLSAIAHWMFNKDIYKAEKFLEEHILGYKAGTRAPWWYDNNKLVLTEHLKDYSDRYREQISLLKYIIDTFDVICCIGKEELHNYIIDKDVINIGNRWLSDYVGEIMSNVKKHNHIQVISNTGSGKTEMIKRIVRDYSKAIVVVPNISHIKLYSDICTPIMSGDEVVIDFDKSYVMVWDQFRNHYKKLTALQEHLLVFDETHKSDTELYRPVREWLKKTISNEARDTIELTATQTNECVFTMKYYKPRQVVECNWLDTDDVSWSLQRVVKTSSKWDKVVIYSDRFAESLYWQDKGSALIHSKYASIDSNDSMSPTWCKETIDGERLIKKHTYITSYADSGINIRNDESVLVVIDSNASNTWIPFVQFIGRPRCPKELEVVILHETKPKRIVVPDAFSNNTSIDDKYNEYIDKNSTRETKIDKLTHTGYINVTYMGKMLSWPSKVENPAKKHWSDFIRDLIIDGDFKKLNTLVENNANGMYDDHPYQKDFTVMYSNTRNILRNNYIANNRSIDEEAIDRQIKTVVEYETKNSNRIMMDKVFDDIEILVKIHSRPKNELDSLKTDPEGFVNTFLFHGSKMFAKSLSNSVVAGIYANYNRYSKMLNEFNVQHVSTGNNDVFDTESIKNACDIIKQEKRKSHSKEHKQLYKLEYIGDPQYWAEDWTSKEFKTIDDLRGFLMKHGVKRQETRDKLKLKTLTSKDFNFIVIKNFKISKLL